MGKDVRNATGTAVVAGVLGGPLAVPLAMLPALAGGKKVRATLNVKPSQTYYFKMIFGDPFFHGKMVQVPAQEAEEDLAASHLTDPPPHR